MSRNLRFTRTAVVAAWFAVALPCAPALARAQTLALTGATVHTVTGPTLENATIVIENGHITAVGTTVNVPAGATVVPCAGKQIYPGLVDANSMLGLVEVSSVRGTVDSQEAGEVNPNIRAEVQINPGSELIPVARANGLTSALIVPRGGALCGTSALVHTDGWTHEDMQVAAPVALHIQWPDMTPNRAWWETRSDEEQKKARDEQIKRLSDAFNDARAYANAVSAEGQKGIPRHDRDVKWDGMVKAIRGEIPVAFHVDRLNQIRAALKFADEQGLKKIVLVGASDADQIADELKARDIAVIAGPTLDLPSRTWEPYDEKMSQPERLREAGIRFCISNGGGETMNARNLPYQAAMAAAYGLPKDEALKSVTLYPAQIMGVADKVGSIEPGKIADLVVTNGDLLEITTTVEQVYVAGRASSMENRQTRLFHQYDNRPRGPKARVHTVVGVTEPGMPGSTNDAHATTNANGGKTK